MLKWVVNTLSNRLFCALLICGAFSSISLAQAPAEKPIREIIASAAAAGTPAEQREIVLTLKLRPAAEAVSWFEKWKTGKIFLNEDASGGVTPVTLTGSADADDSFATVRVADGTPLLAPDGNAVRINPKAVESAETDSGLRRAMKEVSDLVALADPDLTKRLRAIQDSAIGQRLDKLPALQLLRTTERNPDAIRALDESISIIQLRSTVPAERIAACKKLGEIQSLSAYDTVKTVLAESKKANDRPMIEAAGDAVKSIEGHLSRVNAVGTAFRGISLGSVLLVVAIGLAITFGSMGVINMAHGEFIAVGAYTTYVIQNIFGQGLKLSPFGYSISIPGIDLGEGGMGLYFVAAIPISFLVAAAVGILLERSVIQFLYKRPLESLLAT